LLERDLWIAVMKAQRDLGLEIPDEAIEAYEKARDDVRLERIDARERELRHDVKARLEEFNDLAGYEHIHKGMTSRDLTDNVEQMQIRQAVRLVRDRYTSVLRHMAEIIRKHLSVVIAARTHNVAAQPTTMGRRFAMFAQEMLKAFENIESLLERYSLRGIIGPVGTALDQQTLFGGDTDKVAQLNAKVRQALGFSDQLTAVGQVYPRSLDFEVVSTLYQLGSGPSNFCRTLRLMAGHELAGEGFKEGQVGSSAMPHKMNSRSCERVNGFQAILNGHVNMTAALAGDQWNEGDVSCSVVRRVALPDAFFAIDGQIETFLTVLNEMGVNRPVVAAELARYLPFLASTTILMESVKRGAGREAAHEAIKEHAVAVAREMREAGLKENDLPRRLGDDERIPLETSEIEAILAETERFTGAAADQGEAVASQIDNIVKIYVDAAAYEPGDIL
ncbi:MAG: adenylosuccinate lyase, partial [Candidatus Sumerlaeota bacterium]